jgi:hypothetical protein
MSATAFLRMSEMKHIPDCEKATRQVFSDDGVLLLCIPLGLILMASIQAPPSLPSTNIPPSVERQ